MFNWLSGLSPFRKSSAPTPTRSAALTQFFHPPKHIRIHSVGEDVDECLRELEQEADLPLGDLSIDWKRGMEMASFPSGVRSTRYPIISFTDRIWEQDSTKVGYITGSLYKVTKELPAQLLENEGSHFYHAKLNISKNCPGVYKDNVCTTCGDKNP